MKSRISVYAWTYIVIMNVLFLIVTIVDMVRGTILTAGTASGAFWISQTVLTSEGLQDE